MLFEHINPKSTNSEAMAFSQIIRAGRLPAQMAGRVSWSLAETRANQSDYEWLVQWASYVSPGFMRESLAGLRGFTTVDGEVFDCKVVLGTMLLMLFAEVARRHSSEGRLWADICRLDLFRADTAAEVYISSNGKWLTPRPNILRLIEYTARRLSLRHAFDSEAVGHHVEKRYYLTVFLQVGFSQPGYQQNLNGWARNQTPWDSIDILRGRQGHLQSESFISLWSTLNRLARANITEQSARSILRNSPWILPAWVDELMQLASESVVLDEEYETLSFVSAPAWRWEPPTSPRVICQLQGLDSPDLQSEAYDLIIDGRNCDRIYYDGDVYCLVGRPGSLADTSKQEFELPQPLSPVVDVRLIDANSGAVARQQALHLWDAGLPVNVLQHRGGETETIDPDCPLDVRRSYELIIGAELEAEPEPSDFAVLSGGTHRIYHLPSDWSADLRVCCQGRSLWTPNLRGVGLASQDATATLRAVVRVSLQLANPRHVHVLVEHPSKLEVEYVWCCGEDVMNLVRRPNGTTTSGHLSITTITDPAKVDLYVGLRFNGYSVRPVHCIERLPIAGLVRRDQERFHIVNEKLDLFARDIDRGSLQFVPPSHSDTSPHIPRWYLLEGSHLVAPVTTALRSSQRYAGLGAPVTIIRQLFHALNEPPPQAHGIFSGGVLHPVGLRLDKQQSGEIAPNEPLVAFVDTTLQSDSASEQEATARNELASLPQPDESKAADPQRLSCEFANSYTQLSPEHHLVAWTHGNRLIVLQATRNHESTLLEADWPADAGNVRAVAVWFRRRQVGCTCRDEWLDDLASIASNDPYRLAKIIRWMRLPIASPDVIREIRPIVLQYPGHFLRAWTDDIEFATEDPRVICVDEGIDDGYLAAIRDLFGDWKPADYDEAGELIDNLVVENVSDAEAEAALALVRIDPLLCARILEAYARDNLSAKSRRQMFERIRCRILNVESESDTAQAELYLVARCCMLVKSLLRQDPNAQPADPIFIASVGDSAVRALGSQETYADRHNVMMLSQFLEGRRLIAAHLARILSQG